MTYLEEHRVFIDTDVLVYAYDNSEKEKHKIAKAILIKLWDSGRGVISTQVLQEFFINITRKIKKPLKSEAATNIINDLLNWTVIDNDGFSIPASINIKNKYHLSLRDACIAQAAITGKADVLLSGSIKDGLLIKGIRVVDPFESLY